MRMTTFPRAAAALLASCAWTWTSETRAQAPDGAPPEPATWIGAEAELSSAAPADTIHSTGFHVATHAAWAPHAALELGAGVDIAGFVLDDQRGTCAGNVGLGALRTWIGTGGEGGDLAGGLRLVGAFGAGRLGLSSIASDAADLSLAFQLDAAWSVTPAVELAATVDAGVIWDDDVASPAAGAQLDVLVGEGSVRPILGALVRYSPELPAMVRLRLALEIALEPWLVTPIVTASPPSDPEGHRLGLLVSVVRIL